MLIVNIHCNEGCKIIKESIIRLLINESSSTNEGLAVHAVLGLIIVFQVKFNPEFSTHQETKNQLKVV